MFRPATLAGLCLIACIFAVFVAGEFGKHAADKTPDSLAVPAEEPPANPALYQPGSQEFVSFAREYAAAEKVHRIDELDKRWRGRHIAWSGIVKSVSTSGHMFSMEPLATITRVTCDVLVADASRLDGIYAGQIVLVEGEVTQVTVLGVIVSR